MKNQTIILRDKAPKQHPLFGCILTIPRQWSKLTTIVHKGISYFVSTLALLAARNPKRAIVATTVFSFAMITIGFLTNFNLQVDPQSVYAPFHSLPLAQKAWIDESSGFPEQPRPLTLILHNENNNVLGLKQLEQVFEALDTIRGTPGYQGICGKSTYKNLQGDSDCKIFGVTRFWGHSLEAFHQEVHSDDEAIDALSAATYPGGTPVYTEFLLGYSEREIDSDTVAEIDQAGSHNGTLLTSTKSYFLRVNLPDMDGIRDFEMEMLNRLGALKEAWEENPEIEMQLSYFTLMSYELEFARAINKDLVLVPIVVFIMSAFTCLVFYKRDRVQSRSLLGIGSVATIGLSLTTGYGVMFIIGVPFTSMSQILPFVVFGVGLDDTFIITGAYFRTDPNKDTVNRIEETMLEVGQSIALTTITTMLAFAVGSLSTIPAIRWVCIYAFSTICIGFVYQITAFVALLVLDEQRIQQHRYDCCTCFTAGNIDDEFDHELILTETPTRSSKKEGAGSEGNAPSVLTTPQQQQPQLPPVNNFADRFMEWYCQQLMKPWVKAVVVIMFTGYFAFCAYSTTNLTQQFRTQDFVPEDSYVGDFLHSLSSYSEQKAAIQVYFRNVNQSDPVVQGEMREFMRDLMDIPAVNGTDPLFCWVMDFEEYLNDLVIAEEYAWIEDLSFSDKVTLALMDSSVQEAYGDDIVIENGTIVASRCWLNPAYLDMDDVSDQIDLLSDQRTVSLAQSTNRDTPENLNFFTYEGLYFIWEFYAVAVDELIFTTVAGIIAVTVVSFFLIEHWSATLFIFPMIVMLYVELLGTLQLAGLYINVVTYVIMVVSIGLLVDFLLHIVLRYYESTGTTREAKVKETLLTMGASIMVGGLSTFLGTIPLAFSTSAILRTVFSGFFAMVTLGVTHGLILLPVLLSLFGPTLCVHPHNLEPDSNASSSKDVEDYDDKFPGDKDCAYGITDGCTSDISVLDMSSTYSAPLERIQEEESPRQMPNVSADAIVVADDS